MSVLVIHKLHYEWILNNYFKLDHTALEVTFSCSLPLLRGLPLWQPLATYISRSLTLQLTSGPPILQPMQPITPASYTHRAKDLLIVKNCTYLMSTFEFQNQI